MRAAEIVRRARRGAGLSLRELADRAGTSHSAIAAYESGAKQPSVATVDRVVRAAGYAVTVDLEPRIRRSNVQPRGQELVDVLELAAQFPARHAARLRFPPFGRG